MQREHTHAHRHTLTHREKLSNTLIQPQGDSFWLFSCQSKALFTWAEDQNVEEMVKAAGHDINHGILGSEPGKWNSPKRMSCYLAKAWETAVCRTQLGYSISHWVPYLPTEPTLMYPGEVWLNQYLSKKCLSTRTAEWLMCANLLRQANHSLFFLFL